MMWYNASTGAMQSNDPGEGCFGDLLAERREGWEWKLDGWRPPETAAAIQARLINAVQGHMDAAARVRGYDDVKSAVTYADEPAVLKFQAEGLAYRAWRSLVWAYCYAALDDVLAGTRAVPTAEELIAELPVLVLPE